MKNMVFYEYTLLKMLKSVSTYITAFIAIFPTMLVAILAVSRGSYGEQTLSMTTFFVFPIAIIFLSFKLSQVFRDEIENKTLLTIQAKPITRKQMVYQGLLAVNTLNVVLAFTGGILPFLIESIFGGGALALHGLLVMLTEMLLLCIISVIGLWLSLSLNGKAFIGVMIGGFVAGFYVLFGFSAFINLKSSRPLQAQMATLNITKDSNIKMGDEDANGWRTVSIDPNADATLVDKLTKIYDIVQDNSKQTVATITAWFNPSIHWTKMFAAIENVQSDKTKTLVEALQKLDIWYLMNADGYLKSTDAQYVTDANGAKHLVSFKLNYYERELIPVYYPYIIWIAIAGVFVPLIVRSITRKNIA